MSLSEWEKLRSEILECRRCRLWRSRTNAVPGEGPVRAKLMLIGEAPGRQEDVEGRPFVGAAGKLLTDLLESNGISRTSVFITNVVKCRPPQNRDPQDDEVKACTPYLERQIKLIRPGIIVCLGRHAARFILSQASIGFSSISSARGKFYSATIYGIETLVFVTYHPAAALYKPPVRTILENDFKLLSNRLRSLRAKGRIRVTLDDFLG